ncbi:Cullin protein, partial [Ochromonadaceae sp. CCMP2298]
EDRSVAIEAAIIQIMKASLTLSHTQLVTQVRSQLFSSSPGFRNAARVIKRRIEALIDREYLERDEGDSQMY